MRLIEAQLETERGRRKIYNSIFYVAEEESKVVFVKSRDFGKERKFFFQ